MNQMDRIRRMENILDEATQTVENLRTALESYEEIFEKIRLLEAYYTGPLWRQDYEDDCRGRLPKDLKRGVLSEDAVYHLLADEREIREIIRRLKMNQEH